MARTLIMSENRAWLPYLYYIFDYPNSQFSFGTQSYNSVFRYFIVEATALQFADKLTDLSAFFVLVFSLLQLQTFDCTKHGTTSSGFLKKQMVTAE